MKRLCIIVFAFVAAAILFFEVFSGYSSANARNIQQSGSSDTSSQQFTSIDSSLVAQLKKIH